MGGWQLGRVCGAVQRCRLWCRPSSRHTAAFGAVLRGAMSEAQARHEPQLRCGVRRMRAVTLRKRRRVRVRAHSLHMCGDGSICF